MGPTLNRTFYFAKLYDLKKIELKEHNDGHI